MNKKIFRRLVNNPLTLIFIVILAILETVTFMAQMTLLSRIVNQVFRLHEQLNNLVSLMLLLLSAIILHAAFVGLREVVARQWASGIKSRLREHLLIHLLQLGPSYSKTQQTGELVTVADE